MRHTHTVTQFVDGIIQIGLRACTQLSASLGILQVNNSQPIQRSIGIVLTRFHTITDSQILAIILQHTVAGGRSLVHIVRSAETTLERIRNRHERTINGSGQTRVTNGKQIGNRKVLGSIHHRRDIRIILRCGSLRQTIGEQIGIESVLRQTVSLGRRAGIIRQGMHKHILRIMLGKDHFLATGKVKRIVSAGIGIIQHISALGHDSGCRRLGSSKESSGAVRIRSLLAIGRNAILAIRTFKEADFCLDSLGKVTAPTRTIHNITDIGNSEIQVIQYEIHHFVTILTGLEDNFRLGNVEFVIDEGNITESPDQPVILEGTNQTGDTCPVSLGFTRNIHLLNTRNQNIGTTNLDIRRSPVTVRNKNIVIVPVTERSISLVIVQCREVERTTATAVTITGEVVEEGVGISLYIGLFRPEVIIGERIKRSLVQHLVARREHEQSGNRNDYARNKSFHNGFF